MRIVPPVLLAALAFALPAAAGSEVALESEQDKTIYAVGVAMGRNLDSLDLSEKEIDIVERGIRDHLAGAELAVDVSTYAPKISELLADRKSSLAEKEKEASKAFLAESAAQAGAVKTDSGLIYVETKAGDGANPAASDTVKVHYHGTLRDGSVFDSSRDRGTPATFPLNRVIPCWSEALQLMKVGGTADITCPSEIAYGDRGVGAIKPGAALHFQVELLGIEE